MKKNLSFLVLLFVIVFTPALRGLYAQKTFEGTITWTMTMAQMGDDEKLPMIINIKGNKSETEISFGAMGSVKTYSNLETKKTYTCADMGGRKMNYVADMDDPDIKKAAQKATDSLDLKPTGKKETIAGHSAEEFLLTGIKAQGATVDASIWAASGFPKDIQESLSQSLNKQGQDPKQTKAFRQLADKGLVPVRVVMRKGGEVAMSMEFVKYEQKSLDDSVVTPPADVKFSPMPKMPGGMN
jgi:hypothetical protein